ncbi:MAG: putative sulfoacetate transporter SauU [Verrucomicrobiota bacterium]
MSAISPVAPVSLPPTGAASRTRFMVLAGLCGAAVLAYTTRNALGVAESTVRADLALTKEQTGWLMSLFFWPYALCQIPGAWLGQRLGARRALPLFAVLWSLASAGLSIGSYGMMVVMRMFMGVSQAGLVPVCAGVLARWIPRTGQALASGSLSGFMSVGGVIAAPLTAWLIVTCGWRWAFALYAIPGFLWAAWFHGSFRNQPAEHSRVNEAERQLIQQGTNAPIAGTDAARVVPWRQILTSPAMGWICAQQFFRAAGYIFFSTWFATYLQEARGMKLVTSGLLVMLPLLADVAGSLSGGALSDAILRRTGSAKLARKGLSIVAMVVCALLTFSASFSHNVLVIVVIISAGTFCAAMGNPCSSATTMSMGGAHVATVMSMMNMSGNLGAALFPLAVPWLLAATGSWNAVLLGFSGLYVAAAVCWSLLKVEGTVMDQALAKA